MLSFFRPGRLGVGLGLVVALTVMAGCSRSDGRTGVSGKVTLDGAPLATGSISFQPAPGNAANSAGAVIRDGAYELPAASGLKPGKYLVTVSVFKETGQTTLDAQGGRLPELGPVRFNEAGKLEATVTGAGGNKFNFQLTTARR